MFRETLSCSRHGIGAKPASGRQALQRSRLASSRPAARTVSLRAVAGTDGVVSRRELVGVGLTAAGLLTLPTGTHGALVFDYDRMNISAS